MLDSHGVVIDCEILGNALKEKKKKTRKKKEFVPSANIAAIAKQDIACFNFKQLVVHVVLCESGTMVHMNTYVQVTYVRWMLK